MLQTWKRKMFRFNMWKIHSVTPSSRQQKTATRFCMCALYAKLLSFRGLNCGPAIFAEAPESQSVERGWNVNIFRRLIGIQATGPLPVKSEQRALTWRDVCVCTWLWMIETQARLRHWKKKLWLKSEGLLRLRLTMPSNNLNSQWFGLWQQRVNQTNVYPSLHHGQNPAA